MKNLYFIKILLTGLILIACVEDNSPNPLPSGEGPIVNNGWKIVSLIDKNGVDRTKHMGYYKFNFKENGSIEVMKNNTLYSTGTWKNKVDSGKEKLIINIEYQNYALFEELNEDWEYVEKEINKISLQNKSGGNGGTSTLTLII
jgi:hypothetical protein